jgi:hypothetical protein
MQRLQASQSHTLEMPILAFAGGAEVALILLIVYMPWGNALIGTAPLPSRVVALRYSLAMGLFTLEELRKMIMRHSGCDPFLPRNE